MRPDDEHATVVPPEPGVGVEQVGGAVQRDHGLARAGSAVDDERARRARADDRVLVGGDRGQHVPHPRGPARAEARDERGLVVGRRPTVQPVRGEHLVPVVGDAAHRPPVAATAHQAHRLGAGRAEVGRGGRRAPVDQQLPAGLVGQPEPADVDRLGRSGHHHAAQAQVDAVGPQHAQPCRQAADLLVALHGLLAQGGGQQALGVEALGELGDLPRERRGDGGEVPLVRVDERGGGLGGEALGQRERGGGGIGHGRGSRGAWVGRADGGAAGHGAPHRGPCGKPPGALYVGGGGGAEHPPQHQPFPEGPRRGGGEVERRGQGTKAATRAVVNGSSDASRATPAEVPASGVGTAGSTRRETSATVATRPTSTRGTATAGQVAAPVVSSPTSRVPRDPRRVTAA